jgi:hypothetical protein
VPGFSEYGSEFLINLKVGGCLSRLVTIISAIKALRHGGIAVS